MGHFTADKEISNVSLASIVVRDGRLRALRPEAVDALRESMQQQGLLQPIVVRLADKGGFYLVAGHHRYQAAIQLKWRDIPCRITSFEEENDVILAEIDENLIRSDLTPVERAAHQARRKAIYQELHPETKPGGDHGNQYTGGKVANGQVGQEPTPRFDEAAAQATGQSQRSVRRDVQRAESLGESSLTKIVRTSLDSGAEMDALIKLPEYVRQDLIKRAAKGQKVSAQAEVQKLVAADIEAAQSEMDAPAAHMAGRVHPAGDLDFSPTPPWATRALVERVLRHAEREKVCKYQTAWEPACGEGHMAEVLREYFRKVVATDIDPGHGYADHVGDFLDPRNVLVPATDWIITNPPFKDRVLKFMDRALELAGTGVAMFLHLRYLEGINLYEKIYRDRPPTIVAPFVERVPLVMDKYDPKASTTTAFMWLVWLKGATPQAPFWIPPGCKAALTKPDDKERFTQKPVQKRIHAPVTQ